MIDGWSIQPYHKQGSGYHSTIDVVPQRYITVLILATHVQVKLDWLLGPFY